MNRSCFACLGALTLTLAPQLALATTSAELYTAMPYGYGRFEARVKYARGDGVISSFFMWKDGSEQAGTFWNELDFEKVGADCHLETNPIFGNPSAVHPQKHAIDAELCSTFHVYGYEWTPEYIAWLVDGVEIRRETGATAQAFADNASGGMQIHLNVWPGDASFGGNFSPSILPVHQYIDWVRFSAYADGAFTLTWREDFDGSAVPSNWLTGSWASPKNKSTHDARNVNFMGGCAVLSLTADDATGTAGAVPCEPEGGGNSGGSSSGGSGNPSAGTGTSTQGGAGAATGGTGSGPDRAGTSGGGAPSAGGVGSATAGVAATGNASSGTGTVSPEAASNSIGACSLSAPTSSRGSSAAFGALLLAMLFRRVRSR